VLSFRYPAAIAVVAALAVIGSLPLASQGGPFVVVPLIPLAVMIWAWRAGTDVNDYGLRVRALFGNRVITWDKITALHPDQKGRVVAELTDGAAIPLTAVKATDLPRLLSASGKTAGTEQ
jgi:Bacterial PH domain